MRAFTVAAVAVVVAVVAATLASAQNASYPNWSNVSLGANQIGLVCLSAGVDPVKACYKTGWGSFYYSCDAVNNRVTYNYCSVGNCSKDSGSCYALYTYTPNQVVSVGRAGWGSFNLSTTAAASTNPFYNLDGGYLTYTKSASCSNKRDASLLSALVNYPASATAVCQRAWPQRDAGKSYTVSCAATPTISEWDASATCTGAADSIVSRSDDTCDSTNTVKFKCMTQSSEAYGFVVTWSGAGSVGAAAAAVLAAVLGAVALLF